MQNFREIRNAKVWWKRFRTEKIRKLRESKEIEIINYDIIKLLRAENSTSEINWCRYFPPFSLPSPFPFPPVSLSLSSRLSFLPFPFPLVSFFQFESPPFSLYFIFPNFHPPRILFIYYPFPFFRTIYICKVILAQSTAGLVLLHFLPQICPRCSFL